MEKKKLFAVAKQFSIFAVPKSQSSRQNPAVIDINSPFAWWRYRKRPHGIFESRGHLYRGHLYFLNLKVMNTTNHTSQQEQANSYGLKSVLNSKTAQTNAEHIELSDETRTLIQCRARLSDVYSDVLDVMESYWGSEQVDRITEQFCNTYSELDAALWSLTSNIMADTMLEESYRKM